MRLAVAPGDFRDRARARLPRFLFDYIDGAAGDGVTLRRNMADLAQVVLPQRVLRDTTAIDLTTTLFGQTQAMPVALAPIGLAGMSARRGEVQAARAAAAAGVPFCLSTVGVCSIGEVAASATQPFWFQLYVMRDRGFLRDILAQAKGAGCDVLVVTVDMPVPGVRYGDYRSGLAGAAGWRGGMRRVAQALGRPHWALDVGLRGRPHTLGNIAPALGGRSGLADFFAWMRDNFDPSVTWADLDRVRALWDGALVVKGVLDPDDARLARAAGADGIVVSNHSGRQLDGARSTTDALPAIVEAVGGQMTVLVDGGIRSGTDVARMLSLGADAVLLGRLWAFALAADGERGVRHMLTLIERELRIALALMGGRGSR